MSTVLSWRTTSGGDECRCRSRFLSALSSFVGPTQPGRHFSGRLRGQILVVAKGAALLEQLLELGDPALAGGLAREAEAADRQHHLGLVAVGAGLHDSNVSMTYW
jgi:hypothetical protein